AIEARIYAEDPARNFMPSPGEITRLDIPELPNLRVDTGARAGTNVTVYYDPMIAKVIAWGEERAAAIQTMRRALEGITVEGVKTNVPFLQRIFAGEDFAAGRIHTRYVDERLSEIMGE
ncbi:MAG: biotin carboxylase, partial [Thermomicrobiales bacterium]|nr:biotin carboxylase [Thermomicrobiales bacterium]